MRPVNNETKSYEKQNSKKNNYKKIIIIENNYCQSQK